MNLARNTTVADEHRMKNRFSHRHNFFLHIRPASYEKDTVKFINTFYLGFLAVFLFVLECMTGVLLMVYYVPSPDDAYGSIIRLLTEVPFGMLMRDMHRLAGECMIVVTLLHMLRVYISGAHNGSRSLTWITGVFMLLCTLLLAFSGYLLPWDQLAYWAVTIGTSMVATIPLFGEDLTMLLRGGPEFGGDGLLRFYLLHIVILPLALCLGLGWHYYRIVRLHGISPPMHGITSEKVSSKRVKFFPDMILTEVVLVVSSLTILLIACSFFYDAPLEHHADPWHTPAQTKAPWFFLWLQGGLKFGDSFLLGICFPLLLLIILCILPFFDQGPRKPFIKRPAAATGTAMVVLGLSILSFLGLPGYGVESGPVNTILRNLVPEAGMSRFHDLAFKDLVQGVYETESHYQGLSPGLTGILLEFGEDVRQLSQWDTISSPTGVVIIQQWQENLKRVILRINWQTPEELKNKSKSTEIMIYVHSYRSKKAPEGDKA